MSDPDQRYRVTLCAVCHHPGRQHIEDKARQIYGCRLCEDCPGWVAGAEGWWTDAETRRLIGD